MVVMRDKPPCREPPFAGVGVRGQMIRVRAGPVVEKRLNHAGHQTPVELIRVDGWSVATPFLHVSVLGWQTPTELLSVRRPRQVTPIWMVCQYIMSAMFACT